MRSSRTRQVGGVMYIRKDDFIPKPFEAAALVARIRAVLRRILGAPTQQETRLLTAGAGLKANAELPLVKILARESLGLI